MTARSPGTVPSTGPASRVGPTLLVRPSRPFARLWGVGYYRPAEVVTNEDLAARIDSTPEWITSRSGIQTRYRAGAGETVADLAVRAGRDAVARAEVPVGRIDTVIVATMSNARTVPATAPLVAEQLGASAAAAWDLSAACAGYCYGIGVADALVRAGSSEFVLVIGAERMLDLVDPGDRSTAFLFGDGAGAAVVGPSVTPGISTTVAGSDGRGHHLISQAPVWGPAGAPSDPLPHPGVAEPLPDPARPALRMQGPAVFRWAVQEMTSVAREGLTAAGLDPSDLAAFVPHQANLRIIDAMAKGLALPDHVAVARDIVESGNTSAASVPMATARLLHEGRVRSGDLSLQIGFGAGLAYATQVVVLP